MPGFLSKLFILGNFGSSLSFSCLYNSRVINEDESLPLSSFIKKMWGNH